MDKKLITTSDLCKHLDVCRATIERLREKGMPFVKKGRSVYFSLEDVEKWLGNSYKIEKFNYKEETPVN